MRAEPSVSVIIPAYNMAITLDRCLDSVFSQEVSNLQVIVVNDGSTDGTPEVAKHYGDRILYIEQENQGIGGARNTGLRAAQGDYVAFLDADDYWLPGFLCTCADFLQQHSEAIAVSTGQIIKLWGHADRINPPVLAERAGRAQLEPYILEHFFDFWADQDHISTGAAVIRQQIIEQAGYQRADLSISQDLEYWGYLATYGKWGFIPAPLWVGAPMEAAKVQGWQQRYQRRRRLCPTVEQWEARIVPRLHKDDLPGFLRVRSRIAASYTMNKILAGDDVGSRHIIVKHGLYMPKTFYTRLMILGHRSGWLGWKSICHLIRVREKVKSYLIGLS